MSMRSIGSITVAFGMVSIACKLFAATSKAEDVKFNLLSKKGSRLKQQYIDQDGAVVARDEMVKGYEFAKDQYVTFTPAELKSLEEAGTHTAEITEFVPAASVDPVYFEKSHYLAPDKSGKAYALLHAALKQSQRYAIGKWAARGKQHIVLIRPVGAGLAMQVLLYANEVRAIADCGIEPATVSDAELKLAMQLVEAQSSDSFDATAYRDEVSERVKAAIEQKVQGKEISITSPTAATAQVIDLTAALKASLEKAPKQDKSKGKKKAA